jgi:hypothetical protein
MCREDQAGGGVGYISFVRKLYKPLPYTSIGVEKWKNLA